MMRGDVLGESMVNRKHSERARANEEEHHQQRPAPRQPCGKESEPAEHGAEEENCAARSLHRETAPRQPERQCAGTKAANVGRYVVKGIEIKRVGLPIAAALLKKFR